MKINTLYPLQVLLLSFALIFQFSCSKDSDLLTDYVMADSIDAKDVKRFVVDDTFTISSIGSINLDVLSNDTFTEQDVVTIVETSTPANGDVEINDDDTLTYTPEADTSTTDTFTYTAEVVNEDQTVTTEEGTVTVTVTDRNSSGEIVLNTLKAFPSAFGAGQLVTGGRGGKLYEVTNLNDSGPGSFRDAFQSSGPRVIVIKVEGRVSLSSLVDASGFSKGDVTVIGQTAPGYGITLSGSALRNHSNGNVVIRHITIKNKDQLDYSPYRLNEPPSGSGGGYFDHMSLGWSTDQQTFDISNRFGNNSFTIANCLMAEGTGTGGILGGADAASPAGNYTLARNMWYNITHRFWNMSGLEGNFELYNNYIVNWQGRLSVTNGGVHVDYFNNYADKGNHPKSSSIPVNKVSYNPDFRTYTGFNYVEGVDENPSENQTGLWVNYKSNVQGADNSPIDSYHYISSRQHNYIEPSDGIWDVFDVPNKVTNTVGHNRGTDSDGNPIFLRDALDSSYIAKSLEGTTEVNYRSAGSYTYPTLSSGYSPFLDSDSDGMADSFEDNHGLDKNNAADGLGKKTDWNFGTYSVTNNAGYYNREIYWAYLANDF